MSMPAVAPAEQLPDAVRARSRARTAVPLALVAAIGTTTLSAAPAQGYTVQAGDTVSHLALRHGTSVPAIIAANGLDSRAFIRAGQKLTIPTASAARSAAPAPAAPAASRYTVKPGDTVSHIAARTGTTVAAIVAANGLNSRALIRVGQVLSVPGPAAAAAAKPAPAKAPAPAPAKPASSTYTVKAGDTVGHIAARTGTTVAAIVAANGLDSRAFIRAGQKLTIPGGQAAAPAKSAPAATPTAATYTVKAGDTVSHIAARTGYSMQQVLSLNGLQATSIIRPGDVLKLPGAAAPTPGTTGTSTPMPNTFLGRTYPDATVQAATANRDALAARSVPSREQMQQIIADTARQWGVDPALALAVGFQESGFNMRAVSPANAIGAMQVIPSSGQWASDLSGRKIDLLDPYDNATAGVVILRQLIRSEPDDLGKAIAGYYQGLASVRRNGMFDDTRRYVANVQTLMARFR
jgi:LysM repeat protein